MSKSFDGLLADLGVPFALEGQHHHARKGWVQFDCPFCSAGSGRMRMGYNIRGGYCNCWVCGKHGVGYVLSRLSGLPLKELSLLLAGLTPTKQTIEPRKAGRLQQPGGIGPLLPQHKAYLRSRGFNAARLVALWGLQGIGCHPAPYQWRIFLPACLPNGKMVSWTTRSISDKVSAKYLSAPSENESVPLKEILYGEQHAKNVIIVNEGPIDAWAIGPGAVATCGVGYTTPQLLRISQYPLRVILFDAEPEAQRRAERLCADLAVFDGETFNVVLDTGKDASRASKKEIKQLRKEFLDAD